MFLEWKTSCSWNRNQYHSRHQRRSRQYFIQRQQQLQNNYSNSKCFVSKKLRKCKLTDQVQNGAHQSHWTSRDRKQPQQLRTAESSAVVPVQPYHQFQFHCRNLAPVSIVPTQHHHTRPHHSHLQYGYHPHQQAPLNSPVIYNLTEKNVGHLRRFNRHRRSHFPHCLNQLLQGQFDCLRLPNLYYSIVSMYWQSSNFVKTIHSIILLFTLISLATCQERTKTLYIAGFFPTSRDIPQGSIGRGVLPAVSLALQHVNESPLFTKYNLDLVWNNTKCDAAYGMQAFFRMLDEKPVKIILFGDACPTVTDPIAKASKFFHLIQLSYADTFTSTTANFFRIVPSEGSFNPARVRLLKHFNWTKVGTIYQNSVLYSLPHSKLLTDLDNAGIDIIASQSIADELRPEMYLQKFKDKDVRIILGNFGEKWGQKIFCQAYKEGMYGRRYQWIITGIYEDNWWKLSEDESELLGCSETQLLEAIDGYFATDVLPLSKNATTYYSFETSIYKSEYDRLRGSEYSRFHGYAYDGIWAIALAIQTVDKKLRMRNSQLTIEDFQYRDPFWANLFREALNETQFDGVTGHVSFDKNERRGIVLLQQFLSKRTTMTDIAQYYTADDKLVFENNQQIDWQGGSGPPVDRNTMVISPSRISITLFIVISVFAIIGIIIAFVFLTMNIKYRNQRNIKMSSPYLNNMIIIGCIFTYTSVILFGLNSGLTSENNFPYICASRAWVLMTGFTLAFGSMFSKTWRVHAIFTDISLNKKLIKDYKLFMVVGVLVFIDVATLTTWQIVDPFYRATSQGKPEPSPQNEDILVIPEMEYCQSKRMTIFLGSIYVYKGLLMAFGIFLAWETRQVSIPALNDSKYIGMSVYNVVIMCVIGAGLSFVLKDQQDAAFVIISIFIIFCSTATLCLVFVPKLIELKRNPNAGDRRVRATLKPFKTSRRDSEEVEIHTKIKLATDDNFRFRQRLKEKSYELEALTFRLRALKESVKQVKANEIVVEENDLKQLDNCDQRKLSVASVKMLPNNNKRRKSSTANKIGSNKIEMQEESSPEIVVNSTSIFSLSSEAAQLTVKKGSINEISSGNSSKSSDEISISYSNPAKRLPNCDGKLSGHSVSKPLTNHANGSDPSADQNSISDSDDTSYAKAIQQTINSEVIPHIASQVQSQLPLHCHHAHQCRFDHSIPHHHQCCHHHHHVHHLHQNHHQHPISPLQAEPVSSTVASTSQSAVQTNSILKNTLKSKQNPLQCNNLKEIDKLALVRTRRTQSFGGFLQNQLHDELVPFEQATPKSFTITSSAGIRHTSTSPVRTCSSVGNSLNVVDSSTSSASFIRLFPYLNRSISIDQNQPLRSGQSCPQVRCDIVEYL